MNEKSNAEPALTYKIDNLNEERKTLLNTINLLEDIVSQQSLTIQNMVDCYIKC